MPLNKILYIGAGLDIYITRQLNEASEFIFVDSQPRSAYDDNIRFRKSLYNHSFLNKLIKEAYSLGFIFKKMIPLDNTYYKKILTFKQSIYYTFNKIPECINPMLVLFYNNKTQQSIKYYISTNIIKNICKDLIDDISSCDALYVSNYNPNNYFLFHIDKPIIFIGSSTTIYNFDDYTEEDFDEVDKSSLFYYLEKNPKNTYIYFSKFYIFNAIDNCLEECSNFKDLKNYAKEFQNKFYNDSCSDESFITIK